MLPPPGLFLPLPSSINAHGQCYVILSIDSIADLGSWWHLVTSAEKLQDLQAAKSRHEERYPRSLAGCAPPWCIWIRSGRNTSFLANAFSMKLRCAPMPRCIKLSGCKAPKLTTGRHRCTHRSRECNSNFQPRLISDDITVFGHSKNQCTPLRLDMVGIFCVHYRHMSHFRWRKFCSPITATKSPCSPFQTTMSSFECSAIRPY